MIQNGPDENSKTTLLYFLYQVYDVVRLCKLKISHSLAGGREKEKFEFLPVILTLVLIVSEFHSMNRV